MGKTYVLQNIITTLWHYVYCLLSTEEQSLLHPTPTPDPRYQNHTHARVPYVRWSSAASPLCSQTAHWWLAGGETVDTEDQLYIFPRSCFWIENKKEHDHFNKLLKILFK